MVSTYALTNFLDMAEFIPAGVQLVFSVVGCSVLEGILRDFLVKGKLKLNAFSSWLATTGHCRPGEGRLDLRRTINLVRLIGTCQAPRPAEHPDVLLAFFYTTSL